MTLFNDSKRALIDKLTKIDNLHEKLEGLSADSQRNLKEIESVEESIAKIIEEKTQGFPWLADAISQYYEYRDLNIAEFLDNKLRPAVASAQRVREIAHEKREFQKKFIITRNLIRYYEALFPWLAEFVGEDIDDLLVQVNQEAKTGESEVDPVREYITQGEYEKLSITERNQRALDRYWTKKKTSWQIGRDYERYIGYLYEQKGHSVYYQGIERGLEDLGRDLICKKNDQIEIVQCKYWREDRTIHEKHINQLFGTTVEYFIKHVDNQSRPEIDMFPKMLRNRQITASLVTSASLSDTARSFAAALGIKVIEHFLFERYPSIKCNVSRKNKAKIYHLPFDQQYDRTAIEEERNECYIATVAEAERLGFRRAWRWHGNNE